MTNKELYAAFCNRQADMPIMMQPWWMDAVCAGKEWDVLLFGKSEIRNQKSEVRNQKLEIRERLADDEVVAAMPYLLRKRLGVKYIVMPQMSMFGGVWINSEIYASPDLQERLADLIAQRLREMKIAYYQQWYAVGNPMPYWLGKQKMKVEERVTYRIEDLTTIAEPESSFSKNKKRQLHKAEGLQVDYDMSVEEFYAFHKQCMAERKRKLSYSREFLLVLERKARRLGQSAIIRIVERKKSKDESHADDDGTRTLAAAFVVWDKRYMYYLIPAYLPSAAETGASARLADEAIKLAKEKGLQFDFEGGNDSEGIANHYKQFGSTEVRYSSVSKLYNPLFYLALLIQRIREKNYR